MFDSTDSIPTFSHRLSSLFSTSVLFLLGRYGRRLQYRSHTIVYRRVGSWMRVRWRLTKACHTPLLFEVVEWSDQLRSVTSIWLGAAAAAFKSDSPPAGVWARKKMFGIIIIIIITHTWLHLSQSYCWHGEKVTHNFCKLVRLWKISAGSEVRPL